MTTLQHDFLVEIFTEELPPKTLSRLAEAFMQSIEQQLKKAELAFTHIQWLATPRRLAVLVQQLAATQPDQTNERRGPTFSAAFDDKGQPTQACLGFARSCQVAVEALSTYKTDQGSWVSFSEKIPGKHVADLLPAIIQKALAALPIAKRMRWGNHAIEFVRPVLSVMLLYGKNVIDAEILGVKTGRITGGHRFHCKTAITIPEPSAYTALLKNPGFVIVDFAERKHIIRREADNLLKQRLGDKARVMIDNTLLDEVTGLVEWPIAVFGHFSPDFLKVPQEVLISAMRDHQRYFAIVDNNNKLLPHFITISNIESHDVAQVIAGNERVLRARLSDAAFFFAQDKQQSLKSRLALLKQIVFQAKLGSLHDKTERIAALASLIAHQLNLNRDAAYAAGTLAKTDLTTAMVGEFPELQGVMGHYYALHDGESTETATAITEHYLPRFSGDQLPSSALGAVIAIADRLDTLIGVFGIQQAPTGDKDPFGLRRAALGILRILIEKNLNLDLRALLIAAAELYPTTLPNPSTVNDVFTFMMDRLRFFSQEQSISADVFAAVSALNLNSPYDMHKRMQAVTYFKQLPEAEALSVANKRVSNILSKYPTITVTQTVNTALFETEAERELATQISEQQQTISRFTANNNYVDILSHLASLRTPVDNFFDHVLVMAENPAIRDNRLLLLQNLRALFLHVADIALLQ